MVPIDRAQFNSTRTFLKSQIHIAYKQLHETVEKLERMSAVFI